MISISPLNSNTFFWRNPRTKLKTAIYSALREESNDLFVPMTMFTSRINRLTFTFECMKEAYIRDDQGRYRKSPRIEASDPQLCSAAYISGFYPN